METATGKPLVVKTAGVMDKHEAAMFLETLAQQVRRGLVDVQSVFEGLEITSQDLNGFRMQINGQVQAVINQQEELYNQLLRMYMERHGTYIQDASWIRALIHDAIYYYDDFFEYRDDLVDSDASHSEYRKAEVIIGILERFNDSEIMDYEYMRTIAHDVINDALPEESFE